MMYNNNRIEISGTIGRDPELRHSNGGMVICETSLAMSRGSKDQQKPSLWWKVTAFKYNAELISSSYKKGDSVLIVGSADMEEWEKDGVKNMRPVVIVDEIYKKVWKPKSDQNNQGQNQAFNQNNQGYGNLGAIQNNSFNDESDIPF